MPERRLRERGDAALGRLRIDVHLRAHAADVDALVPELGCGRLCELHALHGLQARLVAPAFDPRRRPELVEQLGKLTRGQVDHLHVALLRLTEIAHPDQRLREAVDRRQRSAQIVCRKRHEAREAGIGGSHWAAGH